MPQQAAALVVGVGDLLEAGAGDSGDAVVPGQALVGEGVVGGQHLQDGTVLLHEVVEEEFGLAVHRVGQRLVEVGVCQRVGVDLLQILQAQPLCGEAGGKGFGARVRQEAAGLPLEFGGVGEGAGPGQLQELVVGRRAPEEEGQPGREIRVGDPVDAVGTRVGGRPFDAEDEVGTGQNRLQGGADALLETAVGGAHLVEGEEAVDVAVRGGAAVGAGGHAFDDAAGAGQGLFGQGGAAGEDGAPRRGVRDAGHVEGAQHGEPLQVLLGGDAVADPDLPVGEGVVDGADEVVHHAFELADEGRRNALLPGRDVDRVGADVQTGGFRFRHPAVDGEQRHAGAVDRDLDLLGAEGAAEDFALHRVVRHDVEDVLAVGGEVVQHREPAARADRRPFHLLLLGRHPWNAVDGGRDLRLRVAQRQPADLPRRAQIPLHDRRRGHLHIGDVVEVRALGVEGEEGAHVDLETQQVLDRVGVLGPVEPLEGPPPRVRVAGRDAVHGRLQLPRHRGDDLGLGPRHPRRRHQAGAELADHLLDRGAPLRGLRDVESLEDKTPDLPARAVAAQAELLDDLVGAGRSEIRCRNWLLGGLPGNHRERGGV